VVALSRSRSLLQGKTHVAGRPGLLALCDDIRDRAQTVAVITRDLVGYVCIYIFMRSVSSAFISLSFLRR
jgi:hypothetical protein